MCIWSEMADDDDGGLDAYLANNPKAQAAYDARVARDP